MKTVGIIQARMGSERLPGKVLLELCGKSVLEHLVERLSYAKRIDRLVVATTTNPLDDALVEAMKRIGQPVFRGSENDVLERFYMAAQQTPGDIILRFTADNPLIDPALVDDAIECFRPDYLRFGLGRPLGTVLELFTIQALNEAQRLATSAEHREHVTPFLYKNPQYFACFEHRTKENHENLRWTIDTSEDYELVKEIYQMLYPDNPRFSFADILNAYENNPHWNNLNTHVVQRKLEE